MFDMFVSTHLQNEQFYTYNYNTTKFSNTLDRKVGRPTQGGGGKRGGEGRGENGGGAGVFDALNTSILFMICCSYIWERFRGRAPEDGR
jgi:hypothetical protein